MPTVLPEFIPGGEPMRIMPSSGGYGGGGGESMMERASRLRMSKETHDLQMQQAQILQPVLAAKAQADFAKARNDLAAMQQTEAMRASAHSEMPEIRADWIAASQLDDIDERTNRQAAVLSRAAKYESIAELAPEIRIMQDVFSRGALTQRVLQGITARGDIQQSIAATKAQTAVDVQTSRNESAASLAQIKADHQKELAELRDAKDREIATLRAEASRENAKTAAGARVEAAQIGAQKKTRAEQLIERFTEQPATSPAPGSSTAPVVGDGWQEITLPSGAKVKVRRKS